MNAIMPQRGTHSLQHLASLVYFHLQILKAEIAMQGMMAENKQREHRGESMAYTEKDFYSLLDDHNIKDMRNVMHIIDADLRNETPNCPYCRANVELAEHVISLLKTGMTI